MALHNSLEGFMGELKALPKGSADRGRFITAHMSHPPFLAAVQKHPQGKQIHSQLMGFLNSPANAGPSGAKVTVKTELNKATDDVKGGGWGHVSNQPQNETTTEGLEAPYKGDWANLYPNSLDQKYFVHNDRHLNQVQASKSPDGKISLQYIPHTDDTYAADEGEFQEMYPGKTYIPYEPATKLGSVNNFNEARQVGDALIQHLKGGGHQSEFQHPLLQSQSMPGRLGSSTEAIGKPQLPQKLMNSEQPAAILKSEGDTSVAEKEYTIEEAAAILRKDFHEKLVKYSVEIENLVKREDLSKTAKSVIPSHKHNQATAASSGTEDIAAGQANPKGMDKCGDIKMGKDEVPNALPAEKAEKCMKCGEMHKPLEKCGKLTMGKSDLVDSKGKQSDNHTDPQSADLPDESPKEPEKRDDSSGGKLTKKGPKDLAKAARKMNKSAGAMFNKPAYTGKAETLSKPPVSEKRRAAMGAAASGNSTLDIPKKVGKEFIAADKGGKLPETKKAQPPMAKPPSGGAPGASMTPPMSKPAAPPKMPGAPALGKNFEQAAMESKEKGLEKAGLGMAAHGQREAQAMGFGAKPAAPAAAPKLPGAPAQAARQSGFQDQMADVAAANKPAAPAKPNLPKPSASGPAGAKLGLASPKAAGVTQSAGPVQNAARPVASKPGIFGKLLGKKQST